MALKVVTWNIEHGDNLITEYPTTNIQNRRQRIRDTIEAIDRDILCMQEGPKAEQAIDDFSTQVLDRQWVPILLRKEGEALGTRDKEYQIKGTQWIWFLVRAGLEGRCNLQSPSFWQALTTVKSWLVNPWGEEKSVPHSQYRHPQVLAYEPGNGEKLELIGVHMKSKINKKLIKRDGDGNLVGEYVNEALRARIELATEARNIRQ